MHYKTNPCLEGKKCSRGAECPMFHNEGEKREPVMVMQRPSREDFVYDKVLEMSMNLSNINQLMELIQIALSDL